MTAKTIAIIGAGNMGASLLGGLIRNNYPTEKIWLADPAIEQLEKLQQQFNTSIHITTNNSAAIEMADVIIFAIKPLIFPKVTQPIAAQIQLRKPLVISVAAGVRESNIQHWLKGQIPIVRAMPNTPALIGCGATALVANQHVSVDQRNLAETILRAVGMIVWIEDEKHMDAVTALSGCGPAYFFLIIEALQNAGEKLGLTPEISRLLTLETAYGATRMALESDKSMVELRRQVTSPGGATERAIHVLEEHNIHKLFSDALRAASRRAEELAEILNKEMGS